PVSLAVKGFPSTYCTAVDVLRPIMQANKLDFTIPETSPIYYQQPILPTIANLPFDAWLQVDYLSSDGTMTHLWPAVADKDIGFRADPARLLPAGSKI